MTHQLIIKAVHEIRREFYKMDLRSGSDRPIEMDFIAESNMKIYVIDRNTENKILVGVNSAEDRFFWQPPDGGVGYSFFYDVYAQALSDFRKTTLSASDRTESLLSRLKEAVTSFDLDKGYEPKT